MGRGYRRTLLDEGIEELTLVSFNTAPALRITTSAYPRSLIFFSPKGSHLRPP